jgi:single-stranded-DNA-specific exonuclease
MDKRWIIQPTPPASIIESLVQSIGVDEPIAVLLAQKGICGFNQAKSYFRPSLNELHNPFLMKGMDKAIERLLQAIDNQENILVYGDYDVDGTNSVALVYGFLQKFYNKIQFYIPDRHQEGYGVSRQAVNWAIESQVTLMITLDCGIKDIASIQQAQAAGIDVIVCDHHEPGDILHPGYAVLNPKQVDCPYPFKELSGCGVGFKLLQAFLIQQAIPLEELYNHLDLVAISIACDLVPIVGENRILAYHGLQKINTNPSAGVKAIMQVANLPMKIGISELVFGLGPRLNAAGRVDHGSLAVQLLLSEDIKKALPLAHEIEQKNGMRRQLDSTITSEAIQMLEANACNLTSKTTVLFKEDWHKGVIGIVASRCIERYYRPTIILTASGSKATGSARSVFGYNIYEAISSCADLLDQYGGHAYAAGLTLPIENIQAFQERFEQVVASTIAPEMLTPTQHIDLWVPIEKVNAKFYNIVRQMAPFGNGNMNPVFASEPVIANRFSIVKDNHLKLAIQQSSTGEEIEAIGFGLAKYAPLVSDRKPFRIAYTIETNDYWGDAKLQLQIKGLQGI